MANSNELELTQTHSEDSWPRSVRIFKKMFGIVVFGFETSKMWKVWIELETSSASFF